MCVSRCLPTAEADKEEQAALRAALARAAVEFVATPPHDLSSPASCAASSPDEAACAGESDWKAADKIEEEGVCGVCLGVLWERPDEDGQAPRASSGDEAVTREEVDVVAARPLGARCLRLACHHTYHHRCLERWLVEWRGGQCPTCRAQVM